MSKGMVWNKFGPCAPYFALIRLTRAAPGHDHLHLPTFPIMTQKRNLRYRHFVGGEVVFGGHVSEHLVVSSHPLAPGHHAPHLGRVRAQCFVFDHRWNEHQIGTTFGPERARHFRGRHELAELADRRGRGRLHPRRPIRVVDCGSCRRAARAEWQRPVPAQPER